MISAIQQKYWTSEEFYAQYKDDNRYELIDGEVFGLKPTGAHEEVAAFLVGASLCDSTYRKLNVQIDSLDLPYLVLNLTASQIFMANRRWQSLSERESQ